MQGSNAGVGRTNVAHDGKAPERGFRTGEQGELKAPLVELTPSLDAGPTLGCSSRGGTGGVASRARALASARW